MIITAQCVCCNKRVRVDVREFVKCDEIECFDCHQERILGRVTHEPSRTFYHSRGRRVIRSRRGMM